jgi:hypothetical protein
MVSEWTAGDFRYSRLDEQYGWIVGETTLKGAWYRRALMLMSAADRHGGWDTPGFLAFQCQEPERWARADAVITRALSEVPEDPGQNT